MDFSTLVECFHILIKFFFLTFQHFFTCNSPVLGYIQPYYLLIIEIYFFFIFLYHFFLFRFTVNSIQPTFLPIIVIIATILPYASYVWDTVNYPNTCPCKSAVFTHQTTATFFPLQCSVFLLIPLCLQFHHTVCLMGCYVWPDGHEVILQL